MLAFLKAALSRGGVVPSSTRLVTFVVTLAVIVVPAAIWAFLSLRQQKMLDVPGGLVAFIAAAQSIVSLLFVRNKMSETTS